jgi:hypothetical protein
MTDFTATAVMAAGLKRISSIAERHGINSQETLDACIRWGGILDDVNYPDTTCRHCGEAVTHAWESDAPGNGSAWYHVGSKSKYCKTHAGATATPSGVENKKPVLKRK